MRTTTSSAHKSNQYSNKRPRTNPTSAASVESQEEVRKQEDEKPLEITMKPKEEPKKASNGNYSFSSLKEQASVVKYKECRKNHAAKIGGYVVDGCREFMPSGEEETDAGFICAACSCHRNFHRREIEHDWCCDCSSVSASP